MLVTGAAVVVALAGARAAVTAAGLSASRWWTAWSIELSGVLLLTGFALLYLRGAIRRAGAGHHRFRRSVSAVLGVTAALLALVGPIPALSAQLLWVHMVQHLLLIIVAAPLLGACSPVTMVRIGLPAPARHRLARLTHGLRRLERRSGGPPRLILATGVHILALWLWHTPPVYDAAVASPLLHLLEHASFLGTGVWFWSAVHTTARRDAARQGVATICLGTMIVQGGVLGALIAFAPGSLFSTYTGALGFSAVEDQQFAGALMWVVPGFVYATFAIRRFVSWLRTTEARLQVRESY